MGIGMALECLPALNAIAKLAKSSLSEFHGTCLHGYANRIIMYMSR